MRPPFDDSMFGPPLLSAGLAGDRSPPLCVTCERLSAFSARVTVEDKTCNVTAWTPSLNQGSRLTEADNTQSRYKVEVALTYHNQHEEAVRCFNNGIKVLNSMLDTIMGLSTDAGWKQLNIAVIIIDGTGTFLNTEKAGATEADEKTAAAKADEKAATDKTDE